MKKKRFAIMGLIGMLLLGGCSSNDDSGNKNSETNSSETSVTVDIEDFAYTLLNEVDYTCELKKIDSEYISSYFLIDDTTDAVMYASDETCEEIVVFEATDAVEAKKVSDNIDTFLQDQRATFAAYSPEDAQRIDNAVKVTSDVYIVLCVCDDAPSAKAFIEDVFSGDKSLQKAPEDDSQSDDNNKADDGDTPEDGDKTDNDDKAGDGDKTADATDPDRELDPSEIQPITSDGKIKKYGAVTVVGDTGFQFYGYNEASTKTYANALNSLAESVGDSATIYSIPVVQASAITFPDNYSDKNKSYDQNQGIRNIEALLSDNVKKVNMYNELMRHRTEYLFFRTDHHWTALGAYYAYTVFCHEKGITPNALDSYETKVFDGFKGSYVTDTKDSELSDNPDTITAYLPLAEKTSMHVVEKGGKEYDWPIINDVTNYKAGVKYSTFAAGDNALTTLTNEDLTDDSACIVVKDSYGNAFVPFLVDHYKHVYEIDFRYWSGSLADFAKENNVSDILFVLNISNTGNSYATGKINELCK